MECRVESPNRQLADVNHGVIRPLNVGGWPLPRPVPPKTQPARPLYLPEAAGGQPTVYPRLLRSKLDCPGQVP